MDFPSSTLPAVVKRRKILLQIAVEEGREIFAQFLMGGGHD